jgi:hypothetical protein
VTRVCIVGSEDADIRLDLFSYETARHALATYDVQSPWENTVAMDTVSLGAAVSLLNDLNWYLVRLADQAFVRDPSISEAEWLSRDLASKIRDGDVRAQETDARLKVYGVEDGRLVEPMYLTRVQGERLEYDLRDVEETVVVRVTEDEFEA